MFKKFLKIVFLTQAFAKGQEVPPMQNYDPNTYKAHAQNWAIDTAKNKTIYFANHQGLLTFKGNAWQLYATKNQRPIRSVKVVGDRIYTGTYRDLGYWQADTSGRLHYTSLKGKMKQDFQEDEDIWKIIQVRKWILFQSLRCIYMYDSENESFTTIYAKSRMEKMFKVSEKVYYQKIQQGLYTLKNGKELLISDSALLKKYPICNIFDLEGNLLLFFRKKGFYKFSGKSLKPWRKDTFKKLARYTFYSSLRLKNGGFILGTISDGMYHLDAKGNIHTHINKSKGIYNNTILSLKQDKNGNVWLGLDNGISLLNLESPFRIYKDITGVLGTIYAAVVFKNTLYLGTNQGLFYRKLANTNAKFTFIKGTKGQVWSLKVMDKTLFCGHNAGTFVIENLRAKQISDLPGTWDIKPFPKNKNLLLQGNYSGFSVLEKVKNRWRFKNKIAGFDNSARYFEFVNDTTLLVNHEYRGIYKVTFKADTRIKNVVLLDNLRGSRSSLVRYKNRVWYGWDKGIFYWLDTLKKFVKQEFLSANFLTPEPYISGKLIALPDETLCAFTQKNILFFTSSHLDKNLAVYKVPLSAAKRSAALGFENIALPKKQMYLLGLTHGYLILDLKKFKQKHKDLKAGVFITSISKFGKQGAKKLLDITKKAVVPYHQNSIVFSYTTYHYEKYIDKNFQYKLKGFYNHWSKWSDQKQVSFEKLPAGDYIFSLRSAVGNQISETLHYAFRIEQPYYFSTPYLAGYGIGFLLLCLFVHWAYKVYYKRQKKLLLQRKQKEFALKEIAAEKQITQLKNEQLSKDITHKNKELAAAAIDILNKNQMLSKIKAALLKLPASAELKRVTKRIERDLKNTHDWKRFEEAFNNADKDFLNKLKQKHPNLTSGDLRLCVYLRLNLSSKEIASLLNISYKSVEVRRYRLRKKMSLQPQNNLVAYILSI